MSLSVHIKHRLDGLSLDVAFEAPAGLTALFGRSGAGKTTVINAVAGLFTPDEGRIVAGDTTLLDTARCIRLPPWRRQLGYVFQDARLFPHLNVRQNLRYGRRFSGIGPLSETDVVDMLGLGPMLRRRPGALSGGEKQRVAIGRALLANPRILLADEPLSSLDAERKEEVLPYFETLRDEAGIPILYVSHSAAEVARLATNVVVLHEGRVERQGTAEEVLADPNVTPLGAREAGALLEATVAAHHGDGLTSLSAQGVPLLVPHVPMPVGARLRVRIEANDVMIALQKPQDISALNVLPATILELRQGAGPGMMVQLDLGPGTLLARITQRSAAALNLNVGGQVFAVLKAVSVAKESLATTSTTTRN